MALKPTLVHSYYIVDVLILLKASLRVESDPNEVWKFALWGAVGAPQSETDCIESAQAYHYYGSRNGRLPELVEALS